MVYKYRLDWRFGQTLNMKLSLPRKPVGYELIYLYAPGRKQNQNIEICSSEELITWTTNIPNF